MIIRYRPQIDNFGTIPVSGVILYCAQITILGHQPFKGEFIVTEKF